MKFLGLPNNKNWNKTHKYLLWTNEEKLKEWQTKSSIDDLESKNEYLDIYT